MSINRPKIAVLMGGPSKEREVSIKSGLQVLSWLNSDKYEIWKVEIDGTNSSWKFESASSPGERSIFSYSNALELLSREVDVVVPVLHGDFGEDGMLQAILETKGIKYIASDSVASSVSFDKKVSNHIYELNGLKVPKTHYLPKIFKLKITQNTAENITNKVGLPCVVKPTTEGSSFGVAIANSIEELINHVSSLTEANKSVMIQELINGTEVTCGIYETDNLWALPVTEIKPKNSEFFDFDAKYTKGATDEITPANISLNLSKEVQKLAMQAHKILGCKHLSRTDFIIDENQKIFVLETNTMPGMTETSLYPQAVEAAGLKMSRVLDDFISDALSK